MRQVLFLLVVSRLLMFDAASAADADFDSRKPSDVLAVLTTNGASGELKKDDKGQPFISAKAGVLGFEIDFYDCDKNQTVCKTVIYEVNWTTDALTLDQVNGWNRWTVLCPSYVTDTTHPHAWMGLKPSGRETRADVAAEQEHWMGCMSDFDKFTDAPDAFLKAHK